MAKDAFNYLTYGPREKPPKKLVVLFHGYGVNAAFMEKVAQEVSAAVPGAVVVCPDAPDEMTIPSKDDKDAMTPPDEAVNPPDGFSKDMQRQWASIAKPPEEMHKEMLALAVRVNGFVDEQRDKLGLKDSDIALMGFSQGGAVAMYTGYTRGREVCCVVGHSNIMLKTDDFNTKVPSYFIHGDKDESFTQADFDRLIINPLKVYLEDFKTDCVEGLGHRTNAKSRKLAAGYIKEKLAP